MMRYRAVLALLLCFISCRRRTFEVIPRAPEFVLRSPDARETPLKDVPREYNGFVRGLHSIDLRPQMQIRIENAYYEKGYSRKGLNGYLGTEVARYEVTDKGLHLLSFVPMAGRPAGDRPVQELISSAQLSLRYYRLYFEILFDRKTDAHGSVLLAADSVGDLDRLSEQLADPEQLCGDSAAQCTIFPEACSVSVEMSVVVNGKAQFISWGSLLSSVVTHPPEHLTFQRLYGGRLTPVKLNANDENERSLPLLPGDHITWR